MPYPSKFAKSQNVIEVGTTRLKYYDLASDLSLITETDRENAIKTIQKNAEIFENSNELGFVMNHRCGDQYLLLVCTFRNDNEIWETVYYDGSGSFEIWERKPPHLPTFCVWEMGIVYHESQAYKKFLGSEKSKEDIQTYLSDTFEGEV